MKRPVKLVASMDNSDQLPNIVYLSQEENNWMRQNFEGEKREYVRVGEKKWLVPAKYAKECSMYYNFEVKPDDTWIVTYPRSGTTWMQELLWLLSNNLDFETAKSVSLLKRYSYLERGLLLDEHLANEILSENGESSEVHDFLAKQGNSYEIARSMPAPRFIKSHFPLSLVPNLLKSDCKVIYVARNPKDLAVSYYYFYKAFKSYDFRGDFESFWNYFQNDQEAWMHRHDPNFLFVFYEEMQHDLLLLAKKVATFLNKSYTDEQYEKLVEHLAFSNFKTNEMVNPARNMRTFLFKTDTFIRQGKSQAWHKMFSPALNVQANTWIRENLKETNIEFPFIDIYS